MSIVTQRIYTGDSIVYAGENGGGVSNSHTISSSGGSDTVVGPFTATSNSGNHGTAHHSLFDANGNSIGYPVPEMPGGPQYVLSADDYGGMAWALFASKIQAALSSSDGSVTFTPTDSGSDVTVRGSAWPMTTFESGALLAYPGILYVGSSITNFILTLAPSIGGEYHIKFTTSSTIGMINLTSVTSWIGSVPTVKAGKTYELDILDNVGVMAEVS